MNNKQSIKFASGSINWHKTKISWQYMPRDSKTLYEDKHKKSH